jgi:hypothetical protein
MDEIHVILLADVLEQRERRLKELAFFTQKKEQLELKLALIQEDLNITETLIKILRKENSANSLAINYAK